MNRICELRKKNGYTQKRLAEVMQIDQSAISYWESGRAFPDTQKQITLANLFQVSIDYMLGRDVPEGIPPTYYGSTSQPAEKSSTKKINVYAYIQSMETIESSPLVEQIDIPSDWEGEYFGIIMKGDSMSPRYLDGDTVIIKQQNKCEPGQDALIFVGTQQGSLKKVLLDYTGSLTLKSINQAYRTSFFSEREVKTLPVKITGIAVELRRKI